MTDAHELSEEEQVKQAYETLARHSSKRGDSFDLGGFEEAGDSKDLVASLLSNPRQLASSLNLSPKQAENIRSIIVGGGTGGIHKLLSQYLGDEVAAALGGLISGYIAKRIIR